MYTYLLIDIIIIFFPLIFSFERKLKFYRNFKQLLFSIVVVGIPMIVWDYFANLNGIWSFSITYITGIRILGLPIEELLFFIVVPYSMIFLWETFNFYIKFKHIHFSKNIFASLAALSFILSLINFNQNYTFTIFLYLTIIFVVSFFLQFNLFNSITTVIFFLLSFIPFLVVNYFLTSLPIVTYNPNEFSDIRITTIPLEDFFYSFLIVYAYILVYELAKRESLK
jgi:lycopene cyclase domain-containing protein